MNNRIRYVKDNKGNFKSLRNIKDDHGIEFTCGFSADGKSGYVKSVKGIINIQLSAPSLHEVKKKIKKALKELGCNFEKEVRQKREVIQIGEERETFE